jgi:hypothetical protein
MTQAVGPATRINTSGGVIPGVGRAAVSTSLLPSPSAPIGSIESLYALMNEAASTKQKSGVADIDRKFADKHAALERFKEQLAKSIEDKKSSSLFKTLATVGMVVVAAAAVVMTLGSATPLVVGVGLALSASGFFVSETKCLDPLLGDGVSGWVGMGMQICGAVVGGFAGGGGTVGTVAKVAEAGSAIAGGCQKAEDTLREKTSADDMREATKAQQQMRRLQTAIDDIIEQLKDAKDSSRRGSDTVNQIAETQGQTLIIAAGGRA